MNANEMKEGVFKAICKKKMDIDTVYFCVKVANQVKLQENSKKGAATLEK